MIYFAQAVGGGFVKIGHSKDVPVRIKQLETLYGRPLSLLATMPGGRAEERAIHARFASLRFEQTEQFFPDPSLFEFMERPLFVSASPVAEPMETVGPKCLVTLKGGKAFAAWFDDLARFVYLPPTLLAEHALREYAARHGFPDEQPDRSE